MIYHRLAMKQTRFPSSLVVLALVFAFAAPAANGAASAAPSCTGGQISAIDQYCEAIPTSTGPQAPHVGTPSVGVTLPPAIARRIASGPYRQLLELPGAAAPSRIAAPLQHQRLHGRTPAVTPTGNTSTSGSSAKTTGNTPTSGSSVKIVSANVSRWSLSGALAGVLIAVSVLLAAVAAAGRRRRAGQVD